eukprot:COSAG02_NODE_2426_length_8891_cov_4.565059_7_plen_270_part_00
MGGGTVVHQEEVSSVLGLFGGSFDSVAEALADAKQAHNLDLLLLLRAWHLAEGSADAARLCRCIRTVVEEEVLACGNPASIFTQMLLGSGELRLLRTDGTLLAALAQAGNSTSSSTPGRDCTPWRSDVFDGDEPLVKYFRALVSSAPSAVPLVPTPPPNRRGPVAPPTPPLNRSGPRGYDRQSALPRTAPLNPLPPIQARRRVDVLWEETQTGGCLCWGKWPCNTKSRHDALRLIDDGRTLARALFKLAATCSDAPPLPEATVTCHHSP